jgi:beta-lactamase class A
MFNAEKVRAHSRHNRSLAMPAKSVLCIVSVLCLGLTGQAQDKARDALRHKLSTEIQKIADQFDGLMGVAIKDLTTGEEIFINEQTAFPTASSIKVQIAKLAYDNFARLARSTPYGARVPLELLKGKQQ